MTNRPMRQSNGLVLFTGSSAQRPNESNSPAAGSGMSFHGSQTTRLPAVRCSDGFARLVLFESPTKAFGVIPAACTEDLEVGIPIPLFP
jgi:hypothetical protein